MFFSAATRRTGLPLVATICVTATAYLAACGAPAQQRDSAGSSADSSASEPLARALTVPVAADTDDFGAPLPTDATHATRIVSLNPMATEVLFAIGAGDRLVGRSAWDEFPEAAKRVPSAGDGIKPNVEAVLGLRPTLVILYATAENRAAASAFARAGVRTMSLRVDHIADFVSFTRRLGVAVGEVDRATVVRDSVTRTLDAVRIAMQGVEARRVVWPVWLSPVMVIGGGSFIDELLVIAGAENSFHEHASPSPQVSVEEIARRDPEFVVASASQAENLAASAPWRAVRAVREGRFVRHDPAVTGRPSVTLGMAAVQLARALHPERAGALPK